MKVSLDLVEQNECNRSYSSSPSPNLKFGVNPDNQICAGQLEGGKDTCQVRKYNFNSQEYLRDYVPIIFCK